MPETNAQLSLGSVQSILATVVAKSQECGFSDLEVCTDAANLSYVRPLSNPHPPKILVGSPSHG